MSISSSHTSPNRTITDVSMRPSNPFIEKSINSRSDISILESISRKENKIKLQKLSDVSSQGNFESPNTKLIDLNDINPSINAHIIIQSKLDEFNK